MPGSVVDRLKSAWNTFRNADKQDEYSPEIRDYGIISSSYRPDRARFTRGNERSIINAVYNRIAMDVSAITINHVRLDEQGRFNEIIDDGLNRCLTLSANMDQTGRSLIQDAVMSLLDEMHCDRSGRYIC